MTWNIWYPVSFGLILCRPCQPPLQPHISPPNHSVFSWNFQWAKRHKWHINITQHHIPKGSWPIMSIIPQFTQLFDKHIRIILSDRKKVKRPIKFSYGKSINWASGMNWCKKYFSIWPLHANRYELKINFTQCHLPQVIWQIMRIATKLKQILINLHILAKSWWIFTKFSI